MKPLISLTAASDPSRCDEFLEFMKSVHSEEHLLFWKDVEEFKSIRDTDLLVQKAESIIQEFLQPGAPHQINVDENDFEEVD